MFFHRPSCRLIKVELVGCTKIGHLQFALWYKHKVNASSFAYIQLVLLWFDDFGALIRR